MVYIITVLDGAAVRHVTVNLFLSARPGLKNNCAKLYNPFSYVYLEVDLPPRVTQL